MTHLIREFLRFGIVGVIGFIVDASTLLFLTNYLGSYLSRFISFSLAVAATWALNRKFTFNMARGRNLISEFYKYFMGMFVGGLINIGTYSIIISIIGKSKESMLMALAAASLAGMAFNFTVSKWLIFKGK